jgi:hypothetical protein
VHDSRLQAVQLETPLTAVFIDCSSNSLNLIQGTAHSNKIVSLHGSNKLTSRFITRAHKSDSRVLAMSDQLGALLCGLADTVLFDLVCEVCS